MPAMWWSYSKPSVSRVAHDVEPVLRPTLAVMRAGEQAVDQLLVGVGAGVVDEIGNVGRAREASPTDRNTARRISVGAIGLGSGPQTVFGEFAENEGVDRAAGPGPVPGES